MRFKPRVTIVRDTIFALSSGRPPAAIAVVRLSGPRAGDALKALTGKVPEPRHATLARVRDPANGEIIDEALALWFPGPNSETGEDTAELQLHGGRAVVAGVLAALGRIEGLRPAEAGEFTRRAFENGRIDLTAVEGLADLIEADTAAQRRQAYRQLKGLLGNRAEDWRQRMIRALALVEARIDFSDEADVPEDLVGPALAMARELRAEIGEALAGAGRGERLRDGLVVAIAGPPNAGKSTLLNRLAHRDVAIVSPVPGTTRDVLEVQLDLDGYPVTLLDTAGIRDSDDAIEQEGVTRARRRAAESDLVLWVNDATSAAVADPRPEGLGRPEAVRRGVTPEQPAVWMVQNKSDLIPRKNELECQISVHRFILSAKDGTGVFDLVSALSAYCARYFGLANDSLVSRARHRDALAETCRALDAALNLGSVGGSEDLVAEELRRAARELGRLAGRVDVEDLLDVIFRDFCIGK
jgi:tRNA modification GTPase